MAKSIFAGAVEKTGKTSKTRKNWQYSYTICIIIGFVKTTYVY